MNDGIRRQDVYLLLKEAVVDGLLLVQKAIGERLFIGRYYEFPKLGSFEQSGFPHFLKSMSDESPLDYTDVFGYPEHLENFGWLRPPPVIDTKTIAEVSSAFKILNDIKNNSLAIAARRLNAAQLRKDESDSILDVTIALEALLGDESKTEMTHKLAMRMAALSKIEPFPNGNPTEVFKFVKQIYGYRSAIVHGAKKKQKSQRVVAMKGSEEIPLIELGLKLLRHTILALTKHPEFLVAEKLDNYLLS